MAVDILEGVECEGVLVDGVAFCNPSGLRHTVDYTLVERMGVFVVYGEFYFLTVGVFESDKIQVCNCEFASLVGGASVVADVIITLCRWYAVP